MNEEQLQELLSVYRYRQPLPVLTRRFNPLWFAAAAAVLIAIVAIWPKNDAKWRANGRVLQPGDTISQPVDLKSHAVGVVSVGANTVIRFEGGNRLSLAHGTIHAKTISPPGIFIVDTPRARAVDIGCEYVLSIGADGSGVLLVTAGWVALNNWAQTLVPQGARASIDSSGRLSAPVFDDALPEFKDAIARGDFKSALPLARRRDALTLINLFRRATPDERLLLYKRLNELVPAPAGVRPDWTDPWWPAVMKASGVPAIKKNKRPR